MDDFQKLQQFIYSGDAANIHLALTMARSMGIDLQALYRDLQACIEFYESQKRQLYNNAKLYKELQDNGLDLNGLDLEGLPNYLSALAPISTQANLSHNRFFELPAVLLKFRQLKSLNLASNNLRQLPDAFWEMQNIETLQLDDNFLMRLPARIERMLRLRSLSVTYRSDLFFPEILPPLEKLCIHFLIESSFPALIFQLKGLRSLHLSGAALQFIPENLGELSGLETLQIQHSQLTQLPESLANLQNLKTLELVKLPNLQKIPDAVFELTNLENLSLRDSPLFDISPKLRHLRHLKKLCLIGTTIRPDVLHQRKSRIAAWLPDTELSFE